MTSPSVRAAAHPRAAVTLCLKPTGVFAEKDSDQQSKDSRAGSRGNAPSVGMLGQTRLMDEERKGLVELERRLLTDALELLDDTCPQVCVDSWSRYAVCKFKGWLQSYECCVGISLRTALRIP